MTKILIIIGVAIAALYFIPFLRTILRWIIFLPIGLLAGILIQYLDIPALIASWLLSMISPIIALIFDVVDVFISFAVATLLAKEICPLHKTGWYISFGVCLAFCVFNLITFHKYALFPIEAMGSKAVAPPIIWWQVAVLFTASIIGGTAGKEVD